MSKTRTAVVGVGYFGQLHAQKYASLSNAELVAVADIDEPRCAEVAARFGVSAVTDYRGLVDQVDAVSIAVPAQKHFEIASWFVNQGVHVLVEKPITVTTDDATTLVRMADDRGVVLQVGHLERFNACVLALQPMVQTPSFIEAHRLAPFKERAGDVNVVLDLMIHDIDIIHTAVDAPVRRIDASGTKVISNQLDLVNARIQFDSGCVANLTCSRVSLKSERKIRLFQKDAYFSLDLQRNRLSACYRREGATDTVLPGIAVEQQDCEPGDPLMREIETFVASVISGVPPKVSGEAGKQALDTALKIIQVVNEGTGWEPAAGA